MKGRWKRQIKVRRCGYCREKKQRHHKSDTRTDTQRSKRETSFGICYKLISGSKFPPVSRADREKRISIEYEAFCQAKVLKKTPKIINKRKRREAFKVASEHLINSIVDRSISRAMEHVRSHNSNTTCDNFIVDACDVVIEAISLELKDSENCEFCRNECTLFQLKRKNSNGPSIALFEEIGPKIISKVSETFFFLNFNENLEENKV